MKPSRLAILGMITALGAMTLVTVRPAITQAPTSKDRIAALKNSLAQSQKLLKQYEWLETTVVSMKGEEKSRTVKRCYYGADGKLQKVVTSAPPAQEKKKGIKGKAVEKKAAYMKSAVALVKSYVPPDPALLQASQKAGKMSITPAGSVVRLEFRDYQKAGDLLSIEIDTAKNTLSGLKVATWLEDAKDKVALATKFGALDDGATYAVETTLSAPSESIEVKVTNSGYKKP